MMLIYYIFIAICVCQQTTSQAGEAAAARDKRSWIFTEFPGAIPVETEGDEQTNTTGDFWPNEGVGLQDRDRRWAVAQDAHQDGGPKLSRSKPKPVHKPLEFILVGHGKQSDRVNVWNDVTDQEESFITRGHDAYYGFANYQVSLQMYFRRKWYHLCGASLVEDNKVVTAGHCVQDWGPDPSNGTMKFRVGLGWNDLSKRNEEYRQTIDVTKVHVHPKYDESHVGYHEMHDIAVLTLASRASLTAKVDLIPLADDKSWVGYDCDLTGWGKTERGMPTVLQRTMLSVLDDAACRNMWTVLNVRTHDTELCAMDFYDRSAACSGDSGGPLVCGGRLVGVVSWGLATCSGCFPSVFTRVRAYRPWLAQQLRA